MKASFNPARLSLLRTHASGVECFGDGEHGSALIETALCLSVLLTLMFGLMQTSLELYAYHYISEAAREGTRYAIVRGSACTGWATACPATAAQVASYVKGLNYPGIDPAAMTVTTTWPTTGTSCTPSVTPCNNPGNLVQVKVQYQFLFSVPLVPSTTFNLSSTSKMGISQ